MFAGHAAVALAARPILPRQSLGALVAAAFLIDLIWPVLLLLGVEQVRIDPGNTAFTPLDFVHYPWTHSLLTAGVWGVLFAVVVLRRGPAPRREYGWLVAIVVSHWLLDALSHRPDLPLAPGTAARIGLGLWRSVPATLLVEGTLFLAAVAVYVRATTARDRTGAVALWSWLGLIFVIWLSGPFSPPPPSERAIAVVGLLMWLFPPWAAWADRHRTLRRSAPK